MELRQLRYLIEVNESSTFIKAAEHLNLAQPALSRQIQSLEKEIGSKLFVRGRRGVSLTPSGAVCVGAARSIVKKADAAIQRVRMADVGRIGHCGIYMSAWALWTAFSARLIAHLKATEPGITVSLEESGTGGHWGSVSEGKVDLAIATKPYDQYTELHSEALFDDVVDTAILPLNHRLAHRTSIDIHELKDEPFLIYEPAFVNYVDHDLDTEFAAVNFTPVSKRYFPSSEALIPMVQAGFGWSIHRRSLRGKIPGIAMVQIRNVAVHFPVTIVRRKGRLSPVVRTVIRRIRELASLDYPDMYVPSPSEQTVKQPPSRTFNSSNKLELRDLRYFVAAAEEKTVGRAALKLGITQPALSRQLRELEEDLAVELLTRSARGVRPTPAGEAFLADAKEILGDVERLPHEVARGERAVSGQCMVGAVPSAEVQALISSVIGTAAKSFPDIDVHIRNVATPLHPAAIRDGAIDLGICHPFPGLVAEFPEIDCREILRDTIDCALVAENHPLAKRESIDISELAKIPFLFFRREFHPAFHDYLMEAFRGKGFRPLEGAMQEGLQTMWALTAAGEGWSLGFGRQLRDPPRGTAAIPIRDFALPWGVVLLTRREESRPMALAVIDIIHRAAQAQRD